MPRVPVVFGPEPRLLVWRISSRLCDLRSVVIGLSLMDVWDSRSSSVLFFYILSFSAYLLRFYRQRFPYQPLLVLCVETFVQVRGGEALKASLTRSTVIPGVILCRFPVCGRRNTATSCRSTRISTFFDCALRNRDADVVPKTSVFGTLPSDTRPIAL